VFARIAVHFGLSIRFHALRVAAGWLPASMCQDAMVEQFISIEIFHRVLAHNRHGRFFVIFCLLLSFACLFATGFDSDSNDAVTQRGVPRQEAKLQ